MLRSKLNLWYHNEFKKDKLYIDMQNTIEDSPWHREENVGIHTDMVVSEFVGRSSDEWNKSEIIGFLTCVFHDIGKPKAQTEKYSPVRGYYNSFNGHEKISARLFENYIYTHPNLITKFKLSYYDIYIIGWLIEYHLPWSIAKPYKRIQLTLTVANFFNINLYTYDENDLNVYFNILYADQYGRISDNANEKIQKVEEWIVNFKMLFVKSLILEQKQTDKILYMPIAPSGSGKTSISKKIECDNIHSLDTLRLELYSTKTQQELNIKEAFRNACHESFQNEDFNDKYRNDFIEKLKINKNLYVDNTNTSKKYRRFYLIEAKKRGYTTVAILMPNTIENLIQRNQNRSDKEISTEILEHQYMKLQLPSYGEFDKIIIMKEDL